METAEKSKQEKFEEKILRLSFCASLIFTLTEVAMGLLVHSYTIMMDGIFDIADLVLLGPFLLLVPLLYQPVTEKHPYGYAQVESVFLIVKYGVLLIIIAVMIYANIRVIISGGHTVDGGVIARYEIAMGFVCLAFFLTLRYLSRKYESPTIRAELYLWKKDVLGSMGVAVAFFAQEILGGFPQIAFLARYMDSAVAIVLALFLLKEPIVSIRKGLRQLMLFAPKEETMEKIRTAVDDGLEGLPYTCSFLDVIHTGRKIWIEVYMTADRETSLIDTRHWMKLRYLIKKELESEFDQIYVELIPDLPEAQKEDYDRWMEEKKVISAARNSESNI